MNQEIDVPGDESHQNKGPEKRLWPQAATPRVFELGIGIGAFPRREPLELGFTDEEQRLQAGIKQHNNGLPNFDTVNSVDL